jgi:quinol monooxygenase YgiN
MLFVIGRLKARPGQAETLQAALLTVVAATHREPGNVRYDLHQVRGEPGLFWLYEIFADEAALEAHFQADHSRKLAARFGELLAEPLQFWRLDKLSQDWREAGQSG